MVKKMRGHLTYANVMSTIAVVLTVGGGAAYAGHLVVKSFDIVDDQVKSVDVRDDTLTGGGLKSADIKNSAVASTDVKDESLTGDDIDESSLSIYGSIPGRINDLGAAGTMYGSISGTSTANASPTAVDMLVGSNTIEFTGIAVRLTSALGGGESRTFSLANGTSADAVSCTIFAGQDFCLNNSNIIQYNAAAVPVIRIDSNGAGLSTTVDALIGLITQRP